MAGSATDCSLTNASTTEEFMLGSDYLAHEFAHMWGDGLFYLVPGH